MAVAEGVRVQGRGRWFFNHLAWAGTLRAGGQGELKVARCVGRCRTGRFRGRGPEAHPAGRLQAAFGGPGPCGLLFTVTPGAGRD